MIEKDFPPGVLCKMLHTEGRDFPAQKLKTGRTRLVAKGHELRLKTRSSRPGGGRVRPGDLAVLISDW